jgi:hypothetical protein
MNTCCAIPRKILEIRLWDRDSIYPREWLDPVYGPITEYLIHWMIRNGFSTGFADTVPELLEQLEKQIERKK